MKEMPERSCGDYVKFVKQAVIKNAHTSMVVCVDGGDIFHIISCLIVINLHYPYERYFVVKSSNVDLPEEP